MNSPESNKGRHPSGNEPPDGPGPYAPPPKAAGDLSAFQNQPPLVGTSLEVSHDNTMEEFMLAAGVADTDQTVAIEVNTYQHNGSINPTGGEQASKYKLRREIARGGMGIVMEAEDLKLTRNVAIKVMLAPSTTSKQNVLRFVEEARITSRLQHPGIMPIYELGTDQQGKMFYTMKHVTGKTLKDILKELKAGNRQTEAAYPFSRLLQILQRVCDAVAYAHSRDVIHRDLKPENIMIGDYGEVLVLDWGLAKDLKRKHGSSSSDSSCSTGTQAPYSTTGGMAPAEGTENLLATIDGSAIGTPGYMAPEQARGQVSSTDERSDIYSLGAILYHILALEPTVTLGKTSTRREVLEQISTGKINPLKESKRAPKSLITVAVKALSLHPNDRYRTVKDFQADLDAYIGGFATSVEELSLLKHLALFVRRHKATSVFSVIILSLLAAGLSTNYAERLKAEAASRRAEEALSNLKETAPALALLSDAHMQRSEMEEALKIISNVTALVPEMGEYHNKRGNILQTLYKFQEASEEYEKVSKLAPGNKNAAENLVLCREMLKTADTRKLFLSLRRQNRLQEAIHVITPLRNKPKVLDLFLKDIMKDEKISCESFQVDSQGNCNVELSGISDLSPWRAFPINSLRLFTSADLSDLSPLMGMPITRLYIARCPKITDISPLKGMPLTSVFIETPVRDLTPLAGMPLTSLAIQTETITDVTPLKGMQLTSLSLKWTHVADLSPITGMPLTSLNLCMMQARDLTPLKGMPLAELDISAAPNISDLSPITGMQLASLSINNCPQIKDLTPLKGMPLTKLTIDPALLAREKDIIMDLKLLKNINDINTDIFWKSLKEN